MDQKWGLWVRLGWVILLMMSCTLANGTTQQLQEEGNAAPTEIGTGAATGWSGDTYQNQDFSFSVPEGWAIHEGPSGKGDNAWNYFALDLEILVEARGGNYMPSVTITQRDIPAGSSFEQVFADTYAEIAEQINQIGPAESPIVDGLPGSVIRYDRPWGEPWYSFQDTWVQAGERIYVVACAWKLNHREEEPEACHTVLESIQFRVDIPEPTFVVEVTVVTAEVSPEATAEAEATDMFPPGGCPENLGKIVFSYDPMDLSGVHYGIYIMDADGGGRVRLSSEEERHHNMPSWSPERCRIAFASNSPEGEEDIYVMNADGTAIRRLTDDPARDMIPEWSADGKQIAFISYRDGSRNLFVMEADGSQQRQLTFNLKEFTQWLAWSPDGEYIAYTYNPEGGETGESIHIIRPDGSGGRPVTPAAGSKHDGEPSWSPDSQKLYFLSNRSAHVEIWEINLDGSGLRQISNLYGSGYGIDHSLRISPDGNYLVFYGGGEGAEFMTDLYRIGVDGSGLTNLTRSPGREEWVDW